MNKRPDDHPPGYEPNQYSIYVRCENCKTHYVVWIDKGVFVKDFLEDKSCNNCGCEHTLKQES